MAARACVFVCVQARGMCRQHGKRFSSCLNFMLASATKVLREGAKRVCACMRVRGHVCICVLVCVFVCVCVCSFGHVIVRVQALCAPRVWKVIF
jgi:hypothetical protein